MVRERLNAVDVAGVVCNLRKSIVDYSLANIYDVSNRVYVLKFSKNEDKKFVLFEIGNRIHTTQFLRSSDKLPSNFNVKLRKHLRTRRLRDVTQVAQDRVVDFTFSAGEYAHHLIVQFFLPGNIYLTDAQYKVLAVLRPQNAGEASFKVGSIYEIQESYVPWSVPLSFTVLEQALQRLKDNVDKKEYRESKQESELENGKKDAGGAERSDGKGNKKQQKGDGKGKKAPRKDKGTETQKQAEVNKAPDEEKDEAEGNNITSLVKAIFPSVHRPLVDHVIKSYVNDAEILLHDVDSIGREKLFEIAEEVRKTVESVAHSTDVVPGFLFKAGEAYDDFSPFELRENAERFIDFNDALDVYFTTSEMKKIEKIEAPKKPIKLKKIKDDQDRREQKLEREIDRLSSHIQFIEQHQAVFDSVLDLLRALVASGASWREIMDQLETQREMGHQLARHIKSVNIPDRQVTVCLPSDEQDFYKDAPATNKKGKKKSNTNEVDQDVDNMNNATLDYGLTCFKNLEVMYRNKKRMLEKLGRTRIGREFALKRVDGEKEKSAKKATKKPVSLRKVRKRMWFEKFHWFISSDGFLVLGGRDATQNELLVKRYLTKGDLYFHADIHGAASCILKNPHHVLEVPTRTIEEAACFATCLSNAWTSKMMISAWWVHHDQVSRSAPSGEYLLHGSFMIRGKKNFVPAQRLEMAIGVVFHVESPGVQEEDQEHEAETLITDEEQQPYTEEPKDDLLSSDDEISDPMPTNTVKAEMFAESSEATHVYNNGDAVSEDQHNEEGNCSLDEDEFPINDDRSVRFDMKNVVVHDIEVNTSSFKNTLERKPTGHVSSGFDPAEMLSKLSSLGIVTDVDKDIKLDSVRFLEPEKAEHAPESTRRLKQRMPTGIPGALKQKGKSKMAAMKEARARRKYGEDDEETQQLRLKLLGSKALKHKAEKALPEEEKDSQQKSTPREVTRKEPIKPLDETELESHMRQFRNLSKNPEPEDVIISAIPMCAPYSALKDHPYHIKLLPGHTKKGAISSMALHHFLSIDKSKAQYLKLITVDQFALALIEDCKIPGGTSEQKRA